jgi:hypothetical protein
MISNVRDKSCRVSACKYNIKGFCGLNVIAGNDLIEEQCSPTNNWHVVGSFVLDRIFGKNTAKDIDLVMPESEMPASLPEEFINSELAIEMVWQSPEDPRGFDFYNISLPRITERGLEEHQAAEELKKDKIIRTLPGIRKVHALSIFTAAKTMAKYGLKPDEKTLRIWKQSILSPLGWKKDLGYYFMSYMERLMGKSYRWDYVRAEYLISKMDRVYETTADVEKPEYLNCVREILLNVPLEDGAYESLLKYVNAKVEGDNEKINQLMRELREAKFEKKGEGFVS